MHRRMPRIKRIIMENLKNNTKEWINYMKKSISTEHPADKKENIMMWEARGYHAKVLEDIDLLDRMNYVSPKYLTAYLQRIDAMNDKASNMYRKVHANQK